MASEKDNNVNFWDELIRLRDEERARKSKDTLAVVKGKGRPLQLSQQGFMRSYMHPSIDDTVVKTMIFFVQEIPPNSRSGLIKCQGNQVIYVWQGKGYSMIDQVKHPWEAGDVIQLPLRPNGVTCQHYNDDPELTVKLVCVEPNNVAALGVDKGSGFEQLELAPEYENR